MGNGNALKMLVINGLIKNKYKHVKSAFKLCSVPAIKEGGLQRASGQDWDVELGSSISFCIYFGTPVLFSVSFSFGVTQFVDFSIHLIQTVFRICINQILPVQKCDQEGRETTHCDLHRAYTALFLLYIHQWELIANYPNISMIIFQALL